jgi:hypothetical protein
MEILSYDKVPSFKRTQELIYILNDPEIRIDLQEHIKKYTLIIFHAEIEMNIMSLYFNTPLIKHLDKDTVENIFKQVVKRNKYEDLKLKFQNFEWRDIVREYEKIMKVELKDNTFHINSEKYDELIDARHQIAHMANTDLLIEVSNLENWVLFMEHLIQKLKEKVVKSQTIITH